MILSASYRDYICKIQESDFNYLLEYIVALDGKGEKWPHGEKACRDNPREKARIAQTRLHPQSIKGNPDKLPKQEQR